MTDRRFQIGALLTGAYVLGLGAYAWHQWEAILLMTPNEFGDALAGAASPLAFLWLVLGYLQQGEELRQNTHALHLQAEELKNSVEQQSLMVETSRQQLEAERQRHEESLRRAEEDLLPKFVMSIEKADTGGGNRNYKVRMRNVGAKCTGLKVILDWGNGFSQSEEIGDIDSFGAFQLAIAWPFDKYEKRNMDLILQYFVLRGGVRSSKVPMEFFWVVEGLFFLRSRNDAHLIGPDP